MKILVAAKRVIDPDARIKLLPDGSGVDVQSVEYKVNPFCENAIEEALALKEEHDAEVVIVSIGPDDVTPTIRSGLAMGADRGIRVESEDAALDSDLVARILAGVFKHEGDVDIVLLGKQAVDGDNNQVGQLLAQYLELPQACFASEVKVSGGSATVTREVDGGLETLELPLPAVITADLRLNEPRYASLPGIMKAKRKPIDELSLADLGITDTALKVEVVRLEEPPARHAGVMVESVDQLIDKLVNVAKVL
ncbi:MAG: electron transfer flavoprotein subunit beta/FixA family protein [Deltaproteobacteria bacterium]|nr:electron transfer flavoprotein subunit beta/FixA family protein [Deltaproteobacteria bacterium]MCB9786015.1 electron transfer flavoprotein subunit beta/FixA family protein [Deltaproteobacteria bacterium]